jgi:hypothetical protein
VGGGAASGDGSEGAALAEEASEIGGLRFVHRDSRFRDRTNLSGGERYVLLILNRLGGEVGRKTGHVCPVWHFRAGPDAAPLFSGYDPGVRNLGPAEASRVGKWFGRC